MVEGFVRDEIQAMARELAELASVEPKDRVVRLMRLRDALNNEIAKTALIIGGDS